MGFSGVAATAFFVAGVGERAVVTHRGIVDEHVKSAERTRGEFDCCSRLVSARHVSDIRLNPCFGVAAEQVVANLGEPLCIRVHEDNCCAFVAEYACSRGPDATSAACNQRDLVSKS